MPPFIVLGVSMKIEQFNKMTKLEIDVYFRNAGRKTLNKSNLILGFGINDSHFPIKLEIEGKSKNHPAYDVWRGLIRRCYSRESLIKSPSYYGCTVDDEWKYFSKFYEWWLCNYREGFALDKDILIPNNKIYSKHTCIFVPQWVNSFVTANDCRRGKHPLGIYFKKDIGKFRAQCSAGKGIQVRIGEYETVEEAQQAWLNYKLNMIEERKEELDNIDPRLYTALIEKVKSMK